MNPKKISELTQDPAMLEKLHAANRDTADDWIFRRNDPFVSDEDKRYYRMDVREYLAAVEVRRFLEKSPSYTDAVLIYGADHIFSDDLPDFALIEAHCWDARRRFVARVFTE